MIKTAVSSLYEGRHSMSSVLCAGALVLLFEWFLLNSRHACVGALLCLVLMALCGAGKGATREPESTGWGNRFLRDWFLAKFAKANPLLNAKQLREKVLAANSRLVGTLHLIIQASVLVMWEAPEQ